MYNKLMLSAALAALLFSSASHATDGTGTADATVVSPITVTESDGLNFGTFSAGSTQGNVNTNGTNSANIVIIEPSHPADFSVSGFPGQGYTVTGESSVNLTAGAGKNMAAALLYPSSNAALDGTTGMGSFNVNGNLIVGANQPAGNYHGTYTLTVNYQ